MSSRWREWVEKLRPKMHNSGNSSVQIGRVHGDLTVVNVAIGHSSPPQGFFSCRGCPARCCPRCGAVSATSKG